MRVANALIVHADSLERQNAVFFAQPAAIELVVRHDPEEDDADARGEQASNEEYDFPGLDGRPGLAAPDGDSVCDKAAEDLFG
jgi:hypothetical protein